ncbi:hypothetical protein ERD95_17365 [Enterobacteriaceae bacterium ML5]|nr:hypothetical protein ERD95_17365 [Enterobacteriaceae bacterium ML5]
MSFFSLNETTLLSAINSGSIFSLINSAISPSWGITYNTVDPSLVSAFAGQTVFSPTGWISAEPLGEAAIVNSPIEKGSYTSYNKVRRPNELRVVFVLEGWSAYSGAIPNLTNFSTLSRTSLLGILEEMKNTASTYNIETPDQIYEGYDLAHFDYYVGADRGLTLLKVNATFQQVMDIGEVAISSSSTQSQVATNATSSSSSAITTEINQSYVKSVGLDDVKNAWTSGNTTLSDALATTGSGIVSGVNSAAESVSQAWTQSSSSVAMQIKDGVSQFVSRVM